MANDPPLVVEMEILDVTDNAIGGIDGGAFDIFGAAQHDSNSFERLTTQTATSAICPR